jgi:hypothetical protein
MCGQDDSDRPYGARVHEHDGLHGIAMRCTVLSHRLLACRSPHLNNQVAVAIHPQRGAVLSMELCVVRLLQSRRSPILLLMGKMDWTQFSLFTLSTDFVLFILTALFIAHIISSTMSGLRKFPTTALLWLHMPLLTLLYAVGKALRAHAYVNEERTTTFDDEAQDDRVIAIFRQSHLVESVYNLVFWLCRGERRRKSNVKKCV